MKVLSFAIVAFVALIHGTLAESEPEMMPVAMNTMVEPAVMSAVGMPMPAPEPQPEPSIMPVSMSMPMVDPAVMSVGMPMPASEPQPMPDIMPMPVAMPMPEPNSEMPSAMPMPIVDPAVMSVDMPMPASEPQPMPDIMPMPVAMPMSEPNSEMPMAMPEIVCVGECIPKDMLSCQVCVFYLPVTVRQSIHFRILSRTLLVVQVDNWQPCTTLAVVQVVLFAWKERVLFAILKGDPVKMGQSVLKTVEPKRLEWVSELHS